MHKVTNFLKMLLEQNKITTANVMVSAIQTRITGLPTKPSLYVSHKHLIHGRLLLLPNQVTFL